LFQIEISLFAVISRLFRNFPRQSFSILKQSLIGRFGYLVVF